MKIRELYEKACSVLQNSGTENFRNEARWIFEAAFECGREYLIFNADSEANAEKEQIFLNMIERRANGIPVQYVIGSWDFYGESFFVGEGVLIPRPETELLVDFAIDYLKDTQNPIVFDLCAGSGCIGLSVAKNRPDATVVLIEKSPDAFEYLKKNIESFGCTNVRAVYGDVLGGFDSFELPQPDLVLSNPPYIETSDIDSLQSEVHYEPVMALDGGEDGMIFYNAIAEKWLGCCSAVAVECGEGQADSIKNLFSSIFANVYSVKDFNDIDRTVIGKERK